MKAGKTRHNTGRGHRGLHAACGGWKSATWDRCEVNVRWRHRTLPSCVLVMTYSTLHTKGGTPGVAWDFQSPLNFRWVMKRARLWDVSSLASSHKLFDLSSSLYHFRLNRNGNTYWGAQGGNINLSSFQHRKFYCGDGYKTVVRSSYTHNVISYAW